MSEAGARYCIDTSALSDGWTRYYRPIVHRTLWSDLLPSLITQGRLVAPVEVYIELEGLGGPLFDWVNDYRDTMFVEQDECIQEHVRHIVNRYPAFLPEQSRKEWADPWVIATALERGLIVVTGEKLAGGGRDERPRIPDICRFLHVECLHTTYEPTPGLHYMMEREGWNF